MARVVPSVSGGTTSQSDLVSRYYSVIISVSSLPRGVFPFTQRLTESNDKEPLRDLVSFLLCLGTVNMVHCCLLTNIQRRQQLKGLTVLIQQDTDNSGFYSNQSGGALVALNGRLMALTRSYRNLLYEIPLTGRETYAELYQTVSGRKSLLKAVLDCPEIIQGSLRNHSTGNPPMTSISRGIKRDSSAFRMANSASKLAAASSLRVSSASC